MSRGMTPGGGGVSACGGTTAFSPRGTSGVITMKMMISTNSTSIIGVTLIWAFCPLPPMFMLMVDWTAAKARKFPRGWTQRAAPT